LYLRQSDAILYLSKQIYNGRYFNKVLYKKSIDFSIPRHAEFISASLRPNEVLKQIQDDKVIFVSFINIFCQYFPLTEPLCKIFIYRPKRIVL